MTDECMGVAIALLSAHSELRLEIGDLVRAPTEVSLSIDAKTASLVEGRYGRESLQRVLADPKKRAKVAGIVEKLLSNQRLQETASSALEPQQPVVIDVVQDVTDEELEESDE
jgi:hypothetical protein